MLFNSFEFALFLPIVFCLYWFVFHKNLTIQNSLILASSLLFYGWWDWRFLFLLVIASIVDYIAAIKIQETLDQKKKKLILTVSLASNLGILGVFKYFNFFSASLAEIFTVFGFKADFVTLNVILPVGISFYTFQTMSYTIDVYRGILKPTKSLISYFSFVSFFPQLVAGPIERAKDLLPQFYVKRKFDRLQAEDGMRQILWGLFKKIVIADNCSGYVNNIFENYETLPASYLVLGAFYFAFQIYGDFSGYSDIAIGSARLFGFTLSQNFAFPYFSRDIAEFWRRWHISLSSWFRDYVYLPLGGSRVNDFRKVFNVLAIFIISGFWHGANWTFIMWGLLNGLYFIPLMILTNHKKNTNVVAQYSIFPSLREFSGIIITFILTLIAWVFFRANTATIAFDYLKRIADPSLFTMPDRMKSSIPLILVMIVVEWINRRELHGLSINRVPQFVRYLIYVIIIGFIAYFSSEQDAAFIYFQF
jgi:alginate O-acetyltransferase complex protein AlgI